jgi:hypothetical protein
MISPTTNDKILITTKWAKKLIVKFEIFVAASIVAVSLLKMRWQVDIQMGSIGYLLAALVLMYLTFAIIEAYTIRKQ